MTVDITYDNKYSQYVFELHVIRTAFTREIKNAWMLKKISKIQNTDRCFMNSYNMIPTGLWLELVKVAKSNNIVMNMTENAQKFLTSFQLDYDSFKKYVDETFDGAVDHIHNTPFKPYEYQILAAYKMIKYKKCCGEISTSGGKTLISFIMFKYLIDVAGVENMLYIVPNVDLANQSAEKYELYESFLKTHKSNWEIGVLRANLTKKEKEKVLSCNILFGTFQSLCKRDSKFFDKFTACLCDETHHASSDSIKNIFKKLNNLEYSIGVTGTFPKQSLYDYLVLQAFIGPVVYKYTADQLIQEKRGTPIYIVFQIMNWADTEDKEALYTLRANKNNDDIQAGNKILKQERLFVNNSYTRLKYICDMAIQTQKNTLVLFGDIKYGYGQKLYEYIKNNSEKNVYYVDGNTKAQNRDYFKQCMEDDKDGNTIIVASINTFGEGIDIRNLWSIFLVDTSKSERIVRQICGRGLRLYPDKDKVVLFDFVDDLRYSTDPTKRYKDNYLWKHYNERKKIYKEQKFPIYEQKISFK